MPRTKTRAKQVSSAPVEIVVRRGALRRFDQLKKKTAELPVVVSWDRRLADRRSDSAERDGDRRPAERRQAPPFTWRVADFVVVGAASSPEPGKAKRASKRKR
jgi:hypothetical protein